MFQGVFTAIVTPFNEDKNVNEEDLKKLVDFKWHRSPPAGSKAE